MRKALLTTALAFVAAIGVNGAAGAASQQVSAAPARLSTQAAAANYLRSLGINPAGVVVQRGSKNYAGPNCPGSEWNCTTARRVLQIAAAPGANSFTCTPAGGGTVPPNKCVIVQTSTTGNNTASCTITGSTSGVTQECHVTQTSDSGTNRLALKEELILTGAATSGTQLATVEQNNGSGANIVGLTQRSSESNTSSAASVTQSQSASQSFTIDQESTSGANSVDVSQSVAQTQRATNAAATGSQSQSSTQEAGIDQSSSGAATLKIKQSESQSQTAASTGVTQTQSGPQRCCSEQVGTPATATVKQEATQVQTPSNDQTQQQTVVYSSTGNISGTQTAKQDGTTSTSSFSGSTVSTSQSCTDDTCVEGPAPPGNWTPFSWSGGDGAVADGSPFAVNAAAPVVFSVTDAFCRGDRFTISDGATTLGTTSAVAVMACPSPGDTADPAVAFTDPSYSHGTFALAAGSHSIGIVVSTSPFGGGGAFRRVDAMTTAHCTGEGWATFTYPAFASEADCIAFVG
jgi:trimeric autotransporter adhesin